MAKGRRKNQRKRVAKKAEAQVEKIGERQVKVQQSSFSGPIPPPDILFRYDEIQKGFADRIITMAESEAAHRRGLETRALKSDIREVHIGQFCALTIGLAAIIVGGYTAVNGAPVTGGFIGVGGVVGLVYVFIMGRKNQK